MGRAWWAMGLVGGLLASTALRAEEPDGPIIQRLDAVVLQVPDVVKKDDPKGKDAPKKDDPKAKDPPKKDPPKKDPEPDAFARATDMSGEAPAGSFSRMMGDMLGGMYADRIIQVPAYQVTTTALFTTKTISVGNSSTGEKRTITITVPAGSITNTQQTLVTTRAQVPILGRGAFKIAENERPLPEDRFILTGNVFQNVPGGNLGPGPTATVVPPGATTTTTLTQLPFQAAPVMGSPAAGAPPVAVAVQTVTIGGSPAVVRTLIPNPNSTVFREVVGFEKSIFDGAASVGVRAPFFQQEQDGSIAARDFGDLTFVFKYKAYSDGQNGLSLGLAVTAPTGPGIQTTQGDIHSSLIQPFVGGVVSAGDFFGLGFSSVAFPVNSKDTVIMFNDIGVGAVVYKGGPDSFISSIAPVTEVHVTTPLTHRNGGLVYVPDLVTITEGLQIGIGPAASMNIGIAVPVTGPRPFNFEGMVQFNLRY